MFPNKKAYKSNHVILDKDSLEHDLQDFSFTFLELGKFNKKIQELYNIVERWAYFFKHADETSKEDLAKIIGNEVIIQRAYEELDRFNWNEEELTAYEVAVKKQMDYEAAIEQKYDEGKVEERLLIAKKMLQQNMTIEAIYKITGLTTQEINELEIINNLNV